MEIRDYENNYQAGWIKYYRSVWNKGWYKKSEYVHLWQHILLKANHKPNKWFYKGESFKVNTGQFITSRKTLASETGINESKIQRILKTFEIEQQIEQQNLFINRLITITNYKQYQKSEQQSEQQVNSKRTASEQQVNTNNNVKNVKNVKKLYGTHTKLTENEYKKLVDKDGEEFVKACIYRLDNYIGSSGRKYKSHYHTILNWVRETSIQKGGWKNAN